MRRPHLVQILADGAPAGGATAVLALVRDLVASGDFDVSIITASRSYVFATAEAAGIPVHGFDFSSRLDPRVPARLARLLGQLAPDLVHVHCARGAHAFTLPPLRRTPFPVVYTVHGYHYLKKGWAMRQAGALAERLIARRVDAITFVSRADREVALRAGFLGPSLPGDLVHNGIDPDDFVGLQPLDRSYDLLFSGRMHPQKNPYFAIEVMKALRDRGISLLMVGGGALEAEVRAGAEEAGIADRVTFAGAVPRREALRALLSARLYLFPSLWEGLPFGPIEALYCGLPVIASNIPGTDEIVIDGENGRLIDGFDPIVFAEVISEALADAEKRRLWGANGRALVEREFLNSTATAGYLGVYDRLLARLSAPPFKEPYSPP